MNEDIIDSPAADEDDTPVISDTHQVPSSSSFRPTAKFLNLSDGVHAVSSPKLKDLTLPSYLDIILYWGVDDSPKLPNGISLDLRMVLFTMNSLGRLDHYLRTLITADINKHISVEIGQADTSESVALQRLFSRWASQYRVDTSLDVKAHSSLLAKFSDLISEHNSRIWTKEKYERYMTRIVTANKLHPEFNAAESEEEVLTKLVQELEADLLYHSNY